MWPSKNCIDRNTNEKQQTSKAEDQQPISAPGDSPTVLVGIVRPFKDQVSATLVGKQLKNLKQRTFIQPFMVSTKIQREVGMERLSLTEQIKYKNKFDCLVREIVLIRELEPSLNVESDSLHAKHFP